MKLSELLSSTVESGEVYGVDVDIDNITPPAWLKSVGLIYKENNGEIDETLIDTIISYALSGVDVTLEVPAGSEVPDAKYLVSVAANAGFSVSLLLPENDDDSSWAAYSERLKSFTKAMLDHKTFGKYVNPISGFIEYLYIESWGVQPSKTKPINEYISKSFASRISQERENEIKQAMRDAVYDYFGGKDGFDLVAAGMLKAIGSNVSNMLKSMKPDQNGGNG